MKLYHIYLAYDFPCDLQACMLCVAKSPNEAEEIGKAQFQEEIENEPTLELLVYEVEEVDGYKIQLVKESPKYGNEIVFTDSKNISFPLMLQVTHPAQDWKFEQYLEDNKIYVGCTELDRDTATVQFVIEDSHALNDLLKFCNENNLKVQL